jgi:Domain of unknown function (DUF4129)
MERSAKAAALALALVGLLVVVAAAARGGHPSLSGNVGTRPIPDSVQDGFVTLLAMLYVAVVVAIVVAALRYRGRWHDPQSRWLGNFALVTALMLIATAIGYYGISHSNLRHKIAHAQTQGGAPGGRSTRDIIARSRRVPVREAHFQWPLALSVIGVLVLGGVLVYVRARRHPLRPLQPPTLEASLMATVEMTIEDLRRERDPRRAVVAAYAQMERTLAAHGLNRHAAETPFEYLARVLRDLEVRDSAVRTLTTLFEYAKFSPHDIEAPMKEEAIAALLAIRDDLRREEVLAA